MVEDLQAPLARETETWTAGITGCSWRALNRKGVTTLGRLARMTEHEVISLPNIGLARLLHIRTVLGNNGLSLKGSRRLSHDDQLKEPLFGRPPAP